MFDRVYLINLKRRPDRLARFRALQQEHGWPLPDPIIFEAIEGDRVGVPTYFGQGGGAWGCLRSHVTCLERALMDDLSSVLMLEDDLCWFSGAWDNLERFMKTVPDDWDQLCLGGQHIGNSAEPVSDGVVRCRNCQRTHAYAIRGAALKSLLNLWYTCNVHIDWQMGRWQAGWKVYAPDPFIFGQAGGKSDISGRTNETKFWIAPRDIPVVYLEAPLPVVRKLRGYGFHTGYDRNELDLDKGLCGVAKLDRKDTALRRWLDTLSWECASEEGTVVCVYHPELSLEDVQRVQPSVVHVTGQTVEDCLKQVSHLKLRPNWSLTHCLVFRGPREVVDGLGGFHRGYWLDPVSGQDNGIRAVAVAKDKTAKLKDWFRVVGSEAERIGAVPLVWCEAITVEDVKLATDRKVIEVKADTVDEAIAKWKTAR